MWKTLIISSILILLSFGQEPFLSFEGKSLIPPIIEGEECGRQATQKECQEMPRCCWMYFRMEGTWQFPACVDKYQEMKDFFDTWTFGLPGISYAEYEKDNKFENGTCTAFTSLFTNMRDYGYNITWVECTCFGGFLKALGAYGLIILWFLFF